MRKERKRKEEMKKERRLARKAKGRKEQRPKPQLVPAKPSLPELCDLGQGP